MLYRNFAVSVLASVIAMTGCGGGGGGSSDPIITDAEGTVPGVQVDDPSNPIDTSASRIDEENYVLVASWLYQAARILGMSQAGIQSLPTGYLLIQDTPHTESACWVSGIWMLDLVRRPFAELGIHPDDTVTTSYQDCMNYKNDGYVNGTSTLAVIATMGYPPDQDGDTKMLQTIMDEHTHSTNANNTRLNGDKDIRLPAITISHEDDNFDYSLRGVNESYFRRGVIPQLGDTWKPISDVIEVVTPLPEASPWYYETPESKIDTFAYEYIAREDKKTEKSHMREQIFMEVVVKNDTSLNHTIETQSPVETLSEKTVDSETVVTGLGGQFRVTLETGASVSVKVFSPYASATPGTDPKTAEDNVTVCLDIDNDGNAEKCQDMSWETFTITAFTGLFAGY